MKKHILIIAVICLSACKTRQVSIDKTSITDKSVKTEIQKNSTLHIDTGKVITHSLSKKSNNDSLEIEITPDTGIIQIVAGNYIGKASHILIKHVSASSQATDELIQQNKSEITQNTLIDSTIQKNNIQTQIKTKQTSAKGISSLWYWLAAMLVLATIGFGKLKHWF
jgi:hypothetical protein